MKRRVLVMGVQRAATCTSDSTPATRAAVRAGLMRLLRDVYRIDEHEAAARAAFEARKLLPPMPKVTS